MRSINVGIVGVGNCASSLVQGVTHYASPNTTKGLTNPVCAGYTISDVRFSCAFDVNTLKIGQDLSAAIWAPPNNALKFADVTALGIPVVEGILSDGIGQSVAGRLDVRGTATLNDLVEHLKRTQTDVVVNFLPVGSQNASEMYAEAAVQAGCAFVNCIPAILARSSTWSRKFEEARLPLVGDDLKSQCGSTLVHHALVDVLVRNGVQFRHTYQIVSGGNMDFLNMQDPERVKTKRTSKVQGFGGAAFPEDGVHFGAEFVPFLDDRKVAFIRVAGDAFGGTPLEVELRMSVEDSPSAAGNVLDAIRYVKAAIDQGRGGVIDSISSLLMKAPPRSLSEPELLKEMESLTLR